MRAAVVRPFYLRWGGRVYAAGDDFDGPEAQVAALAAMGLVEASGADSGQGGGDVEQAPTEPPEGPETAATGPQTDLSEMTAAQLRELCAERGIDAPKRATKAQLAALLSD